MYFLILFGCKLNWLTNAFEVFCSSKVHICVLFQQICLDDWWRNDSNQTLGSFLVFVTDYQWLDDYSCVFDFDNLAQQMFTVTVCLIDHCNLFWHICKTLVLYCYITDLRDLSIISDLRKVCLILFLCLQTVWGMWVFTIIVFT